MTGSSDLFAWPGLASLRGTLPESIAYERGIWGKAHGQSTDYRWLATSKGLARVEGALRLGRDLRLGDEDVPRHSTYWHHLPAAYVAMRLYPSRARDKAMRGNFSEKQILVAPRLPSVPAALVALVLVPAVARLDDELWWQRLDDNRWKERDFVLEVDPQEHAALPVERERLERTVVRGRQDLAALGRPVLARMYTQILAGRTAWLPGRQEPLSPAALATLLLPLPDLSARDLSLASWLPSTGLDRAELEKTWSLIACRQTRDLSEPGEASEHGLVIARAILEGDPRLLEHSWAEVPDKPERLETRGSVFVASASLREQASLSRTESPPHAGTVSRAEVPSFIKVSSPKHEAAEDLQASPLNLPDELEEIHFDYESQTQGEPARSAEPRTESKWKPAQEARNRPGLRLPISEPDSASPALLIEAHRFICDVDRRWLELGELAPHRLERSLSPQHAATLRSWRHRMWELKPAFDPSFQGPLGEADYEQWAVKSDLIQALELICRPSLESDLTDFLTERVPPLHFLELRARRSWHDLTRGLEEKLDQLIRKSRAILSANPFRGRSLGQKLLELEDTRSGRSRRPSAF